MSSNCATKYLLILAVIFSLPSYGQDAFQRLYTTDDRNIFNLGVEPSAGGGFYTVNTAFDRINPGTSVDLIHVVKYDPKGTILWAREYSFKDVAFVTNLKAIDIATLENDTLLIVGSSFDFTAGGQNDEKFIFKIDPDSGDLVFADEISDFNDVLLPITLPYGVKGFDSDYNYFATHSNEDTLGIQRVLYNAKDSVLLKQGYYKVNEDQTLGLGALLDVQTTVDSNYVLSFIADNSSTQCGILELSHQGAVVSANEYSISTDSIPNFIMQSVAIEATPDSGLVQVGIIVDLNTGGLINHVIKTDSTGAVQWGKVIDGNPFGFISQVNDVVYTSMDEIMVTGKYLDISTFGVADFAVMFNTEGDLLRQWNYQSDNSYFIQINPDQTIVQYTNGELENMADGGMVYSTIGIDTEDPALTTYIIKTDPEGRAFCEDTLDLDIVRDYAFLRSGMSIQTSDFAQVDTFDVQREIYDNYNIPVLTLLDTIFCPQDPIMVTLDATLQTASTYEWSTGETTPSIEVIEEGEYSVTVTFEEKVCYTLCDTSNITKRDFPEAMIDAQFFGVCELDSILLRVSSSNPIVDIEWSTGDTTNRSIIIQDAGFYAVTIVDDCGNSAEAQINISDGLFMGAPEILDIFASGRTCDGVLLTPTVTGQTDGLSYEWSTGETSQSILVTENMQYELIVTNSCGNTDSFSINVQNLDVLDVDILDEGACDSLELFANVPLGSFVGTLEYMWSDGSTGAVLDNLEGAGLYSVTVTDSCGDTATDEYAISDEIAFPNVFYPNNAVNPENRSFGAFIRCPDFFEGTNYRLEVYNRFGNRVFETENVSGRWSGAYSGEIAPRDVYMFQYSYDLPDGETVTGEGHVTLYR